jgi:hypothetical protein
VSPPARIAAGIEKRATRPVQATSAHHVARRAIIPVLFRGVLGMRKLFPLIIVAAAVTACASEPSRDAAQVSPPAVPAPVSAPARVSAAEPTGMPASDAAPAAASATTEGYVAPAGYQKKTRGTKTVYCKSDTPVGTRFAKEYCYTQADLERMEASRTNTRQEIDRARRTCTGGGCGGG